MRKAIWAVSIRVQLFLLRKILKGGEIMMAMFFAQRVILGKTTFAQVPEKLKAQVRELLVDAGLPELAQE